MRISDWSSDVCSSDLLRGKCEAATLSQGGMMSQFVLTVQCKAQRGIVGAIGTVLAEQGCNITDSAQFDDAATEEFFARIGFNAEDGAKIEELRDRKSTRLNSSH